VENRTLALRHRVVATKDLGVRCCPPRRRCRGRLPLWLSAGEAGELLEMTCASPAPGGPNELPLLLRLGELCRTFCRGGAVGTPHRRRRRRRPAR
jgi:hypothetical protein